MYNSQRIPVLLQQPFGILPMVFSSRISAWDSVALPPVFRHPVIFRIALGPQWFVPWIRMTPGIYSKLFIILSFLVVFVGMSSSSMQLLGCSVRWQGHMVLHRRWPFCTKVIEGVIVDVFPFPTCFIEPQKYFHNLYGPARLTRARHTSQS